MENIFSYSDLRAKQLRDREEFCSMKAWGKSELFSHIVYNPLEAVAADVSYLLASRNAWHSTRIASALALLLISDHLIFTAWHQVARNVGARAAILFGSFTVRPSWMI
ncbi:MAG: hypothetical protein P8J02_11725 [Yoonia sp.]|nr:hypothetical protein [Yoonia sp.]